MASGRQSSRWSWERTAAFASVLALVLVARAAYPQHYPFQYFTEIDGLPSSAVLGIQQDDQGRMWFATRSGMDSFDGLEWNSQGTGGLVPDRIFAFLDKDPLGRIWTISMRSSVRVAYTDGEQWVQIPSLELEHSGWTVQGFAVGMAPNGEPLAAFFAPKGYLAVWDGTAWRQVGESEDLEEIHAILMDGDRLLIAAETGLFALDFRTWSLRRDPIPGLPEGPVMVVARRSPADPLWFVGPTWIGRMEEKKFRSLAADQNLGFLADMSAKVSWPDRAGGLYFGNRIKVAYFNPETLRVEPLDKANGLISGGVNGIFEDREGQLWFACMRGVSKLISRRFAHFDSQTGLFKDEVSAILMRRSGEIVLGHDGGLTFLHPGPRKFDLHVGDDVFGRVIDLDEDADGNIWIAADGLGLGRLDPDGSLTWYSVAGASIFSVFVDGRGEVWAGGSRGLSRLAGDRLEPVPLPGVDPTQCSLYVRRILPGKDGSMYVVGGVAGIFHFRRDGVDRWFEGLSPDQSLYTVHEQTSGGLWVGTSDGLFRVEDGKLVKNRAPGPVIDRPVYGILDDPYGRTWFGTDSGVMVWDGLHLIHYSTREGVLGSETNRDALKVDGRGKVWIGTDRGLSIYNREFDFRPKAPPILEIQEFVVDGISHPASVPLKLNGPPHSLAVRYRAVTFTRDESRKLAVWMENAESDWHRNADWRQRESRYTNLAPGNYRFHMRIEDAGGTVGSAVVSGAIAIAKPIHRRWWFIASMIAAGMFLIWILFSFQASRRYAAELGDLIRLRTGELEVSQEKSRLESLRLETTLDSISEGVLALDAADRILRCNPAAAKILGREMKDLTGRTLAEISPELAGLAEQPAGQLELPQPEAGRRWLETTAAPVRHRDDDSAEKVMVLRDVTDRRRRDQELQRAQKLESLGLLAGGLAHDFNNLLTVIRGNIELAEDGDELPPAGRDRLVMSMKAVDRAQALTEQLLTFARGGAPQRRIVPLREILEQACALSFSGKSHTYRLELAGDLWPVLADPGQLNQVLHNILINACQAMAKTGEVLVSAVNAAAGSQNLPAGDYVLIEISDAGDGILPRDLKRIFDPYFSTKEHGMGLGLATAFSIIKRHGGILDATSEPGRGSTFRIYLPRGDGEPAPAAIDGPAVSVAGRRILVMDDDPGVCGVLARFLERLDVDAEMTADGREAIDAYQRASETGRPFDAVLFDLTVSGGMGGREAVEELRKTDPGLKAVVISGYSQDGVLADFRGHGFQAAIAKPFTVRQLADTLAEVLNPGTSALI